MAYKTITCVVTDPAIDETALEAAVDLTRREDGHLDVVCLGIDRTQPGFYYTGASALTIQNNLAIAEKDAEKVEGWASKTLEGRDIPWSTQAMTAQAAAMGQFLGHRLRMSDIVVLPKPYGEGRTHENEAIIEAALFDAGVPVLVMPDEISLPDPIDRIVIGWNESREALTAVRAALPLLQAADVVNIAIVDPPPHSPDRSDPGGALSLMLSRHGVRAEVSVLAKTLPRVSDVLARHIDDQQAQILVMGAYGHSRFRESILGGATRNMLQITRVPLLMAH